MEQHTDRENQKNDQAKEDSEYSFHDQALKSGNRREQVSGLAVN